MNAPKPRTKLDPTDNKLQISNQKEARTYVFIAKIFLKKFGNLELHALGEATKTSVRVAENLQRQSKNPQFNIVRLRDHHQDQFIHPLHRGQETSQAGRQH